MKIITVKSDKSFESKEIKEFAALMGIEIGTSKIVSSYYFYSNEGDLFGVTQYDRLLTKEEENLIITEKRKQYDVHNTANSNDLFTENELYKKVSNSIKGSWYRCDVSLMNKSYSYSYSCNLH